ncbi:2-dehydro-3-deoxygluconokinase [Pseudothermotoga hypogea DSM 11164 = NBRC 106472]|uniref:2-dehydro-3-deoxygluconokinase n=1 Tax=Pseudothermotoga hypogea DSM 11164 = NBRC 106472 TaxID=1123384 RepID=A0A0X1KTN8_9THEM|nr:MULTISPECIES: sugar kinase [Pseudothermotoga]AJC74562.1 2-dehydro-3-deoxygluconokinase [Pseudothermotoga hypogea DSM 11164 = NBRC 106472]MBC7122999.1 sugar kinase [Pseudothermotoga sp.]MDI6862676.1 sugar kinase [Pseudothermotoga sp.]
MARVVTFGEIMMRLATPNFLRFVQTRSFDVTYAGAEANVAVSLANFGLEASFVTKLPKNEFGIAVLRYLRQYNVDTSHIIFGEGRLGVYFLETGYSQRPSKVIYDRANSAFALSSPEEYDWDRILNNANWFHFTGITPALGDNLVQACLDALKKAKEKGIIVSCDLNYRAKLWSQEKAREVMSQLVKYVDVLFANEEDAEKVFGIKADESNVVEGKLSLKGYEQVCRRLKERFGFKKVAISLRESIVANLNGWSGVLLDGDDFYSAKQYTVHIVDRVGAGDSFSAGIIYGLLNGMKPEETLEFAVAASCLKHTIVGDFNEVTVDEVKSLMKGSGSGRVVR